MGWVASVVMGLTLGLMGGGGSILTVPILVYLFGVGPVRATGYSLFIVGLTAFIGSLAYIRRGDVKWRVAATFAVPSLIGVFTSRVYVVPFLPEMIFDGGVLRLTKDILMMIVFAILMVTASYKMIWGGANASTKGNPNRSMPFFISVQGLLIGLISGFVGAGGGFLIVPALVLWGRLTMREAVGTSLFIISIQSMFGFWGDLQRNPEIDWRLLVSVASFAMVGIILGSAFSHRIPEAKLKKSFGWFVLLMGAIIFGQQIRNL